MPAVGPIPTFDRIRAIPDKDDVVELVNLNSVMSRLRRVQVTYMINDEVGAFHPVGTLIYAYILSLRVVETSDRVGDSLVSSIEFLVCCRLEAGVIVARVSYVTPSVWIVRLSQALITT